MLESNLLALTSKHHINFNDLPDEIIRMIMVFVDTTYDICKCRSICRQWYSYWKIVPQIENTVKLGYHHFTPDCFQYLDLSGNLIREIVFKSYGRWIYREYNPNKTIVRKIENTSFFTTQSEDNTSQYYMKILKVDSRAGLIHKTQIPKLMLTPPCTIS